MLPCPLGAFSSNRASCRTAPECPPGSPDAACRTHGRCAGTGSPRRASPSPRWGRGARRAPASSPTGAWRRAPHTQSSHPDAAPGGIPRWPAGRSSSPAGRCCCPPQADGRRTPRRSQCSFPAWQPAGGWAWRCRYRPCGALCPPRTAPDRYRRCSSPRRSRCPAPQGHRRSAPQQVDIISRAAGRSSPFPERRAVPQSWPCRRRAPWSAAGLPAAGRCSPLWPHRGSARWGTDSCRPAVPVRRRTGDRRTDRS